MAFRMDDEEDDVRRGPSGARAVSTPVDRVSDDAVLKREPSLEAEDVIELCRDLASNTTSTRRHLARGSESSLDAGDGPRSFLRPAAHIKSAHPLKQSSKRKRSDTYRKVYQDLAATWVVFGAMVMGKGKLTYTSQRRREEWG